MLSDTNLLYGARRQSTSPLLYSVPAASRTTSFSSRHLGGDLDCRGEVVDADNTGRLRHTLRCVADRARNCCLGEDDADDEADSQRPGGMG